MAEEAKKREAPPAEKKHEPVEKPKGGGLMSKTPVLLGGAMIIEAVVLFAGFKFLSGGVPKSAAGAEATEAVSVESERGAAAEHGGAAAGEGSHGDAGAPGVRDKKFPVEVSVLEFRAPNKRSGRTFLYDVAIYAATRGEFETTVKQKIKDREALIKDRIRTIIAQMDPSKLDGGTEPGLETLRRQIKYQLDEIVGEKMIDEVLVPRCIAFRTDY